MNYIEHLFINFTFENKNDNFSVFYSALEKEIIALKQNYPLKIKSIYIATNDFLFLSAQQLTSFLNLVSQFVSSGLIEYSFEIGYLTLSSNQLALLKKFNINRLVWKVRTFSSKLLANINKEFNNKSLIKLIKSSKKINFDNFSIDLEDNIFAQTKKDIIKDLKKTLSLHAPHISYQSCSDSHNHKNKTFLSKFLKQYKYRNYEFFSFSKSKNNYSQQTLGYLKLKNWYGLGPNSSSFLNLSHEKKTIENSKEIPWNKQETILAQKLYYQFLITQGLMIRKGILLKNEQLVAVQNFWEPISNLIDRKYLKIKNNYLQATKKGWVLLNDVLIDIINYYN